MEVVENLDEINQFITTNRAFFLKCKERASDKPVFMLGFDSMSAKEAFGSVLENEPFHLAQCLYFVYFGDWVPKNETFAIQSLKTLSFDENGKIVNPTMAYIYAYCSNRNDELDLSESVLEQLRKRDFSPAFVTHGDLHILQGVREDGMNQYRYAIELGHIAAKGFLFTTQYRDKPIRRRIFRFFKSGQFLMRHILQGSQGRRFLYLDFYGIKGRR